MAPAPASAAGVPPHRHREEVIERRPSAKPGLGPRSDLQRDCFGSLPANETPLRNALRNGPFQAIFKSALSVKMKRGRGGPYRVARERGVPQGQAGALWRAPRSHCEGPVALSWTEAISRQRRASSLWPAAPGGEWARRVGDASRVATALTRLRNRVAPCSAR